MTITPERWQAVKALFDQALEQPPEDRVRWVSAAAAGDPSLRDEVASLLDALSEEHDRFERSAGISLGELVADWEQVLPSVGDMAGPYRLVKQIGQGGMGVVFEAYRDDDQYRKRVAIKMISRGKDSDVILRRFRHERQILAHLDQKNIAGLLDGGVTEAGQPYFAMEFVEGSPIDQYCDSKGLGVRERLQLVRQACAAVQYAHTNLVIHRDLKPSNILVTADGTVKLLDFGIAKLLHQEEDGEGEGLTQPGVIPLTTAYASPEQIRGETVTTATDVFSLGLVLYRLLARRHAFVHDRPSPEETRRRILEDTPPKPSLAVTADEHRLRRTLAGDLDSIVLMAIRKEPSRRYGSVERLSEDLLRYLNGLPVAAQPDSPGYRLRKFVRRNRAGVVGGVAAAFALLVGLGATAWQIEVSRLERDRAQREAAKATRLAGFLQAMFRAADPRDQGKDVTVAEALGVAERRAEAELTKEPEVLAAVLSSIGLSYLGLGRYDEASHTLNSALSLERTLDDGTRRGVTDGLRNLAALEAERGRLADAEPLLAEALVRARRAPVDSGELGELLHARGSLALDQGDFPAAEKILREAVGLRRRTLGDSAEAVAATLNSLGVAIGQQNRWAEAIPLHQEALEVLRRVKGSTHPDVATGLNTLANAFAIIGQYAAADTLFRQALDQRVALLGPHHPEVAWTHYSYGDMLRLAGDYPRAIVEARAVLAERGGTLPESHPMVSAALTVLGRSLLATGDVAAAESALRESLRLRRAAYAPSHWLVASSAGAVGECLLAEKRYREAEPLLREAHATIKAAKGAADQRTRDLAAALATLYAATGRPEEAAKYRTASH